MVEEVSPSPSNLCKVFKDKDLALDLSLGHCCKVLITKSEACSVTAKSSKEATCAAFCDLTEKPGGVAGLPASAASIVSGVSRVWAPGLGWKGRRLLPQTRFTRHRSEANEADTSLSVEIEVDCDGGLNFGWLAIKQVRAKGLMAHGGDRGDYQSGLQT